MATEKLFDVGLAVAGTCRRQINAGCIKVLENAAALMNGVNTRRLVWLNNNALEAEFPKHKRLTELENSIKRWAVKSQTWNSFISHPIILTFITFL